MRPVWSGSSLSAWRKLGSLATHWAHGEVPDQTGWMPGLIWVFAGRTVILLFCHEAAHFIHFLHFQNLIQTYSLENLLGERKKAHQVMLMGKQYLDGDSASSSEEGEDENNKNTVKELVGKETAISQFLSTCVS